MMIEPSLVGLMIQAAGVALIAVLSLLVNRSINQVSLRYWTAGWASLGFGLTSLLLGCTFPLLAEALQPMYLLGGVAFGHLFVAGCRHHARGTILRPRDAWVAAPALVYALALPPWAGHDVNSMFIPQAAILVGFFAASLVAFRGLAGPANGQGLTVIRVALVLLAILFAHYVPVFTLEKLAASPRFAYLEYSSLYDVILEIGLAFGTVMLITESVREDLEVAHREAAAARDRLEVLARLDPLTESLNRHAFYSLVKDGGRVHATSLRGCAVVVDLDDLKIVNDRFGHAIGDSAIRTVAKAIRTFIRAEDLLFRWGGDEFLALMLGADEAEVRRRFDKLNDQLAHMPVQGTQHTLSASFGVAPFDEHEPVSAAIERADATMYEQKRSKPGRGTPVAVG